MLRVKDLDKKLKGKVDGVIDSDLHGNMKIQFDKDQANQ